MKKEYDPNLHSSHLLLGLLLGILTLFLLLLSACKKTEYVTVEKIVEKHDTTFQFQIRHDSILVKDSIFQTEYVKGDTIFRTEIRDHVKYVDRLRVDTLREIKVVTHQIPVPYIKYVTEYKDKPLSWYNRGLICIGALCLLYLLIKAFPLLSKLKRK